MFNPDASTQSMRKKLPKSVVTMVEKGNLVIAIKTLAADESISMEDAKMRIDTYETELKVKQQHKISAIANKQGIPNEALSFDRQSPTEKEFGRLIKDRVKSTPSEPSFKSLQRGVDSKLDDLGYKKPLVPYWVKRLSIIAIIMVGVFWILWRVFT